MPQNPHDDRADDPEDFLAGIFPENSPRQSLDPVRAAEDPGPEMGPSNSAPVVLSRGEHEVSRRNIDRDALKALYRLIDHGHKAYLVGGAVRDLMLGREPKDFDIATDATPRRVKRLFRNCRIIGRRFRLAHLHYADGKIIEVATFRSSGRADAVVRDGEMIRRDNVYGTAEEDAQRRDLTINGLFYDVSTFSVIDYVGGVNDLRSSKIRMIGDPYFSFREDPIRMLRAIRHCVRMDFQFDPETGKALEESRDQILRANPARLIEELYKDLISGHGQKFFDLLFQQKFFDLVMPSLVEVLEQPGIKEEWLDCLERLDQQIHAGHRIHQSLGIAGLVSPLLISRFRQLMSLEERAPRKISKVFREDLSEVLRQMKVYRRDEERLWAALGGLCLVSEAVQRRSLSPKLRSQPWICDSMVILYVLLGPGGGREEMLEEVRKLPISRSSERPPQGRRQQGPSGRNRPNQRAGGSSRSDRESNSDGEASPVRRRRRRRRRKPSGSGGEKGPRRS